MSEVLVAGVDEVGRGALFGPVAAAAVALSAAAIPQLAALGVRDSKQLSGKRRRELVPQIEELALACGVGWASASEIDALNIGQASLLAMKRAVFQLGVVPSLCLVDGSQVIPALGMPQQAIVGGDRASPLIAAASIVAKVWRDGLITRLALEYPQYDLANNMGYGTQQHRAALQQYGPSPLHRLSFRPCRPSDFI